MMMNLGLTSPHVNIYVKVERLDLNEVDVGQNLDVNVGGEGIGSQVNEGQFRTDMTTDAGAITQESQTPVTYDTPTIGAEIIALIHDLHYIEFTKDGNGIGINLGPKVITHETYNFIIDASHRVEGVVNVKIRESYK